MIDQEIQTWIPKFQNGLKPLEVVPIRWHPVTGETLSYHVRKPGDVTWRVMASDVLGAFYQPESVVVLEAA
jgi:hypothetical protein